MAFPSTGVLDSFTGTNGTSPPNANWTNKILNFGASDGVQITSNAAGRATAGGTRSEAYWSASTFGPDVEMYATFVTLPDLNGDEAALYARLQQIGSGTTDCYVLAVSHDGTAARNWRIGRYDNGTETILGASVVQAVSTGDSFGLEVVGSTLNAYYMPSAGVGRSSSPAPTRRIQASATSGSALRTSAVRRHRRHSTASAAARWFPLARHQTFPWQHASATTAKS